MKKFIVIGLGNFGMTVARSLTEKGVEVLGIDTDRVTVQRAKDFISHAITADCTNKSVIESISVKEFDGAIVSIGQEMASSILICLYLKELGVKKIIARAISEDHVTILKKLGVSEVVFPERDMALRMGISLSMRNALDYLPLTEEYSIMEIKAPNSFIGKKLYELQIGAQYHCQILGIRYRSSAGAKTDDEDKEEIKTIMAPSGSNVIYKGAELFVLGKHADIEKLQKVP